MTVTARPATAVGGGWPQRMRTRLRQRPSDLTIAALALVALQLIVRGWVVSGSYYFQDDFAHLDLARRVGLGQEYLVRDYGGHLEMGQYALIWLLSHVIDTSFAPAAASILVLQAIASLLLFQLLRTLFGESPLILLPWTAYLFTPLALAWSTWWAAALQALPLQIAMVLVILAMTKALRERSWRWGVVAVVAHVVGLLFWEKAALILPAALAVQLLVVSAPGDWRSRLADLTQLWWVWAAHLAVLTGYIVLYLGVVDSGFSEDGDVGAGRLVSQSMVRMFVPGMFGGPWHANGAEHTVYPYTGTFPAIVFLTLLTALVALSWAVSHAGCLAGWFLLAGYLTADLLLLGLGRADWVGLLARDPRYVADALPIMAIAVLAAFRGVLTAPPPGATPAARWLHPRITLAAVLRGAVLLVVSCVVTTSQLAPVVQHEYAKNFALGVARQMESAPERSVVNGSAPVQVSARADIAAMMNAIGKEFVFDRPGTQMFLFDGLAAMRPMELFPGTDVAQGPKPGCGWPVDDEGTELLDAAADDKPTRVLRLGYFSRAEGELEVTVAGEVQSVVLPPGTGRAYFVIGPEAGPVTARVVGVDGVCVTDVAIGPAWVAD